MSHESMLHRPVTPVTSEGTRRLSPSSLILRLSLPHGLLQHHSLRNLPSNPLLLQLLFIATGTLMLVIRVCRRILLSRDIARK